MRFAEDSEAGAQALPIPQLAPQVAEKPAVPTGSSVGPSSHASAAPHKPKSSSKAPSIPEGRRATLETRVSTTKQAKKEHATSMRLQAENLHARAERKGWEVVAFHESHVSGADGKADRLDRLRREAAEDAWDLVAFDNTDRAFRSVRVALNFIEEMKELGKDVWIGDLCVTTASSDERFMLQVLLAASELKRAKNQDAANHQAKKVQMHGVWYHKLVPRGYQRRVTA